MQVLYDNLGLTGETALVERMINQAKDRYITARKWPHLVSTANQLWTSGQRAYTLSATVAHVLALFNSVGRAIERVAPAEYDQQFRPNGATGSPEFYMEEGSDPTRNIRIHVHPQPAANETGSIRFVVRIPDLSDATSTSKFDHIPETHHFVIVEDAVGMFKGYEDSEHEQRELAERRWEQSILRLAEHSGAPPLKSGVTGQ